MDIQSCILKDTEKLISHLDFKRMSFLAILSSVFVLIIFKTLSYPIKWQFVLLVIVFAYIYALIRDLIITHHAKKLLYIHYDYSIKKRPDIQLYIPIFNRTNQVFNLKNASLFISNNIIYLEAYKRATLSSRLEDSIVARCNRDFFIDGYNINKTEKYIDFHTRLLDRTYDFSLINNLELLEIINKYKEN